MKKLTIALILAVSLSGCGFGVLTANIYTYKPPHADMGRCIGCHLPNFYMHTKIKRRR